MLNRSRQKRDIEKNIVSRKLVTHTHNHYVYMFNRSRQKRDIEKNKVPRQEVTRTHNH